MPLEPNRPPQPSFEDQVQRGLEEEARDKGRHYTEEEISRGKRLVKYLDELDEKDPKNWPTDDETKTIPPFHTQIRRTDDEQT
jgi:hypothetical protein